MATVTIPRPGTRPHLALEPVETTEPGWMVILHNDDVTPFPVVVYALQRAAGISLEVAEMITNEAQSEGTAIVKRGLSQDDAEIICGCLRKWTTIDGVCPGVDCEAVHDD